MVRRRSNGSIPSHKTEMNFNQFNRFCKSLPYTTHVIQWGGSHVWKVGAKMFAIASTPKEGGLGFTFKVTPMSYELLKMQKGCRPAPYLASRGMLWIQRISDEDLDDAGLKIYLKESYRLVFEALPKKRKAELLTDS
jgi:predicted DNA-binding protein (MmcQ/YjbR family)